MTRGTDIPNQADEALRREAVRLFRRYQVELVEAFNLCPWAAVARQQGRVRERVVIGAGLPTDEALAAIDELAADESVEIGIVLFPRIEVDRPRFERFVAGVRDRETARRRPAAAPFAMAEFHPEAAPVLAPIGAFTSFVRRTPDPTIQLVRQSVLDRVRKGDKGHGTGFFDISKFTSLEEIERNLAPPEGPPIHERVHDANLATFAERGPAQMDALFRDLRADRDRSYRALGFGAASEV